MCGEDAKKMFSVASSTYEANLLKSTISTVEVYQGEDENLECITSPLSSTDVDILCTLDQFPPPVIIYSFI